MAIEEKIRIANAIRVNDAYVPIPQEEMDKYPVKEAKEMYVKTRVGDAHVYFLTPVGRTESENIPLYVNMHGGGFIKGRYSRDELFCRKIVNAVDCAVIDIDYRLAPEYMFPTALHECYDVIKWALDNAEQLGVDRNRIAVGGHSAGGNFTAGIMQMVKETGDFKVVRQILDYAPTDLDTDPALKKRTLGDKIPPEKARMYDDLYSKKEERRNSLISPLFTTEDQLAGQPPALIITAGLDSLCEETEKYAINLAAAGVEVTIKRFVNSYHSFTVNRLEGYEEAEKMIFNTLKKAFFC